MGAIVPYLPSADPQRFNRIQSIAYQTAIIKNDDLFLSQTKKVKTAKGDSALVVRGPGDGNCLPTALARGLISQGRPLSPNMEQQAMEEVRSVLSQVILEHTWPHKDVASPQTIAQCAEETARNGGWCGEVAMAAFASITGTCLKLYRYVNDEKKGDVIEPLMNWNINEGSGGDDRRHVIHLLQTRVPLPDQPEHCSHWEILIMLPPEQVPVGIEYGPIIVDNKNSSIECYEYIINRNVDPHLRVDRWSKYKIKGRGKKPPMERVICQIHRRIITKRNQPQSYGPLQIGMLSNDGALTIITKSINDIDGSVALPISDIDIREIKSLWDRATAPPPAIVVPVGPAGAARKRKRTPTTAVAIIDGFNSSANSRACANSPAKAKPKVKRHAAGTTTPKKNATPKVVAKSRSRGSSSSSNSSSSSSSESDNGQSPVKQASAEKKHKPKVVPSRTRQQCATRQPPTMTSVTPSSVNLPSVQHNNTTDARLERLELGLNRLFQLVNSSPVVTPPVHVFADAIPQGHVGGRQRSPVPVNGSPGSTSLLSQIYYL